MNIIHVVRLLLPRSRSPPSPSIPKVVVSFVLANRSYTSPLVYSRHCASSRTNNKRPNRPSKHPPLFISTTTSSTTTVCPIPNATGIGISVGGWSPSSRHHLGGGGGGVGDGLQALPRRGFKSRILHHSTNQGSVYSLCLCLCLCLHPLVQYPCFLL